MEILFPDRPTCQKAQRTDLSTLQAQLKDCVCRVETFAGSELMKAVEQAADRSFTQHSRARRNARKEKPMTPVRLKSLDQNFCPLILKKLTIKSNLFKSDMILEKLTIDLIAPIDGAIALDDQNFCPLILKNLTINCERRNLFKGEPGDQRHHDGRWQKTKI
jgi:hypothetical protein